MSEVDLGAAELRKQIAATRAEMHETVSGARSAPIRSDSPPMAGESATRSGSGGKGAAAATLAAGLGVALLLRRRS